MPIELKFHFREGFTGDLLEIRRGTTVLASLAPKTRYQIGLAAMVELVANAGERLHIMLPQVGTDAAIDVPSQGGPWHVLIDRDTNGLRISMTEDEPGYL